jgi:hypothetical protein
MEDDSERRRFGRHDLGGEEAGASLLVLRLERRVAAQAIEIGNGGMRLQCAMGEECLEPGDNVVVRLGAPMGRAVTLPGEIAWVRPIEGEEARFEIGLTFAGARQEVQMMLAPFLDIVSRKTTW